MSIAKTRYTKFCVYCLKTKAALWRGHVLLGKQVVLAGWCKKCKNMEPGFAGHYKKKMKIIKD